MTEPLKPCPFCGAVPVIEGGDITCPCHVWRNVPVDHWNRRAPDPRLEELRKIWNSMSMIPTDAQWGEAIRLLREVLDAKP